MIMTGLLVVCMFVLLEVVLIKPESLINNHGVISNDNCPCSICDAAHGYCVCPANRWGPRCENVCRDCEDVCDIFDGTCGCFYGFRNNSACDSKCGQCNAENTDYCHMRICYCKDNYYGISCNESCKCDVQNTIMGDTGPQCDSSGFCKCKVGVYGKRCDKVCSCPNNGSCYRNGYCKCRGPYWGKYCNKPCTCHANHSLQSICGIYGQCACKHGYTGIHCTEEAGNNTLHTFPPVDNTLYPWVTHVKPLETSHYCLGTIVNPFYIITSSECYLKTEQINTTIIKTLQNTTYYASEMKFKRGVTGDVRGPILLKIDANRHPNGLKLTPTCQPISLPNDTLPLDTNASYIGVGLKYQYEKGFKFYTEMLPGNYTYLTEGECEDDFFRNDAENMFCAKGLNKYTDGCSLIKGSPFIGMIRGTPYLLGIREDDYYGFCGYPRAYHFINIQRYENWIKEIIQ